MSHIRILLDKLHLYRLTGSHAYRLAYPIIIASLFAWGCSDDPAGAADAGDPTVIPAACNPLGGPSCLAPWPSSVYLDPADTPTGYRVALPVEAMPVNYEDVSIDPAAYNRYDGFAPSGHMVALFPAGVSSEGLPPHTDPGASLAADSATVVINMDSGERLLHFAEIDMNAVFPEDRALIIRPLVRMTA